MIYKNSTGLYILNLAGTNYEVRFLRDGGIKFDNIRSLKPLSNSELSSFLVTPEGF